PPPVVRPLVSGALRANLRATAVEAIAIDPRHLVLRAVSAPYAGVAKTVDKLLLELNHPFRNWRLILPELKGFALQHAPYFLNPAQGPECFELICGFFLQAQQEAKKEPEAFAALEGLTAWLDKTVRHLPPQRLPLFVPALEGLFTRLAELPEERLLLLGQSHAPLPRALQLLLDKMGEKSGPAPLPGVAAEPIHALLLRLLTATYRYWRQRPDPAHFAAPGAGAFSDIAAHRLEQLSMRLTDLSATPPSLEAARTMLAMPGFLDIVRGYRRAMEQLGFAASHDELSVVAESMSESRKLRFMFHIMEIPGLWQLHEETLREINRSLVHLVQLQRGYQEIRGFLDKAFLFLKANAVDYPKTALQCVEVLGGELLKRNQGPLMELLLGHAVRFGFQHSAVRGVGNDWQLLCNPFHLYNIRVWLGLIARHPWWCSTLLSGLILNLKLGGTCIRDTDLFQREVTQLLNADISPVYNLVKQFARLLPVYYNEIGAEGELRDVSTELDELTRRGDRLIHFLRKQCHVESANHTVRQAREILHFWRTGRQGVLSVVLPEEWLDPSALDPAPLAGRRRILQRLFAEAHWREEEESLLAVPLSELQTRLDALPEEAAEERRRVFLMVQLYQLLHQKYTPGGQALRARLVQAEEDGLPSMRAVLDVLDDPDLEDPEKLAVLLSALESLKEVILSPEQFEARSEIFQKRHVAVDIPSVYGCYRERKFDALSLSFRLENAARIHLERLSDRIPEGFMTRAASFRVAKYLRLFLRALNLDGIAPRKLTRQLDILERLLAMDRFSFHQYLDVIRGFSEGVKAVVYTYYVSHHRDNLAIVLPLTDDADLLTKYRLLRDDDPVATLERVNESILRDLLAETFGLQSFDNFITRLQRLLLVQQNRLPTQWLDELIAFDPIRLFSGIHVPNERVNNPIQLGAKGRGLVDLAATGAPVPPGAILTTEGFRYRRLIREYPLAREDFFRQLRREVHRIEGLFNRGRYGDPDHPMLLSVRSGALISMPGMMQTILNVGMNETIVESLARRTGNPWFAWDAYRRFIQSWGMSANMTRESFGALMRNAKRKTGVRKKKDFSPEQMRQLALSYHATIHAARHAPIPADPWEQLEEAIRLVMASWSAPKALAYRQLMGIAEEWGTAVVLQAMIFGNINERSGAGVTFTAHPHRKLNRVVLWGDYTPGSQGEDIVGGLVATLPISLEQCQYDGRDPESCLERRFPDVYQKLLAAARHLVYNLQWNPQEIEFTFDGPTADHLFLLQTRDMVSAWKEKGSGRAFRPTPELEKSRLGQGIGVSGGPMCGRAVFNLEQIQTLREKDPESPLILIRYDTVPDDIQEVSRADGLLTARGGQTSHAAIVAARLAKTCVVGVENLVVMDAFSACRINGRTIRVGDRISIDGSSGLFLLDWHPVESCFEPPRIDRRIGEV
ncbi:MAG: phosphoenolpyruvate synthase, partial [Magnetococcales bacterium]|nr:phosphoenolpyruvate synthase [Magnetococcales bacterium]